MIYREIAFLRPIIGAETRFCPQLLSPLNVSDTLNRLNFLYRLSVRPPARAVAPTAMGTRSCSPGGKKKRRRRGDPATLPNRYGVTFCLFTFDYTIWHTFTRSARAHSGPSSTPRRSQNARLVVTAFFVTEPSFAPVPHCPNST